MPENRLHGRSESDEASCKPSSASNQGDLLSGGRDRNSCLMVDDLLYRCLIWLAVPPALVSAVACAEERDLTDKEQLVSYLNEVDEVVASDGAGAVAGFVEAEGDARRVLRKYGLVTSHLYGGKKDIASMLVVGRASVKYTLAQAEALRATDPEGAEKLKGVAKSMCYNLSVNAWPGWKEKGITISPAASAAALTLAEQNLRLGMELKRPASALGNAYWLLGAQHLALKQTDRAVDALKTVLGAV